MRIRDSALETAWLSVLREARISNGISQKFVADAMGVPPYLLSMWEMQDRAPTCFAAWNCWASFFRLPPVTPPTHDERSLALSLRAARMARGASLADVAERLGVHSSNVRHWERCRVRPESLSLWNRWAAAVGAKPVVADAPLSGDLLYGHRGVLGYAPYRRRPCGCVQPATMPDQHPYIDYWSEQ